MTCWLEIRWEALPQDLNDSLPMMVHKSTRALPSQNSLPGARGLIYVVYHLPREFMLLVL